MNECPCMLLCHSNPPKSAKIGGTVVPPSNFQFVTTKCLMIQTLISLSSHGCAQAHTRQILHVRSWLPVANHCSSKCPSKHLTAITQTLANTRQSSSQLANYDPTTIDDVLLTTYLTTSHVHACTPMATIKSPSNSRQTTLQHHDNVKPTTAKQTVSTPNATAKNLVTVLYAAVLQRPYYRQTPRHRPVCSCVTAANHLTDRPQRTLCEPTAILSITCNSLAVNLPYDSPTISLQLTTYHKPIIPIFCHNYHHIAL